MKHKIIKIAGVTICVVSIVLNLYFFAWKTVERKIYRRGVNDALASVLTQARQNGQITFNMPNGQMTLVPKDPNSKK